MAHLHPESDHFRGSRRRGFTLQSLPSSDSTAHDSSEDCTSASPDPFHTVKNPHASSEAGVRREKSEALLNNDWRHNRRPRAETEAPPLDPDLRRASRSLRQRPRIESDVLTCARIKATPVDPEMINSTPAIGTLRGLPDRDEDEEETPIRLSLDSFETNRYEASSHTRRIDDAGNFDEVPNPELFASFAVKPFDGIQQDISDSSFSCLLHRNSEVKKFKARDWNTFDEEEWVILSNAVAKNQSRLLSALQRKDRPKDKRITSPAVRSEPLVEEKRADTETLASERAGDDARYKVCILDKLKNKSSPRTSSFAVTPDFHNRFKAATEKHHGGTQRHSPHASTSETGSTTAMDAGKDFKWNPNAPEFATYSPPKPVPATIACSDPSRARPPLMGVFDPAPMQGVVNLATMPGGFDPAPIPGGFDSALMMGGFDPPSMMGGFHPAPMMGGFDSQLPRGCLEAGNEYSLPVADHAQRTIAETCARLRNMLDQLEVTAANQAERDRYLNYLSKVLLPGAAQQIPGLQTLSSTQYPVGLQTRPAADGASPQGTAIPIISASSQPVPESGAMPLPSSRVSVSNGAGPSLSSVGPIPPFHAAPLPASAVTGPGTCPNGPVPTFSFLSHSNPVGEMPTLQPKGSLSGLPQHNGQRQSTTVPSRRGRGAASDPVPCHPIFGPKPVEKPKGPPRPHDPVWNRQQQMYEAWLEWQRSINPARHLEGKMRQNKRNERRTGSRRSETERATTAENVKPPAQVTVS